MFYEKNVNIRQNNIMKNYSINTVLVNESGTNPCTHIANIRKKYIWFGK